MTIDALQQKLQSVDIEKISIEALEDTKDDIAAANKGQMSAGLNSDGSIIGYYMNKGYAVMKNYLNPKPGMGIVDLRLHGSFYAGIKTNISGQDIITESTDSKNAELQAKYNVNGNIFGLSKGYKVPYIDKSLRPAFNKKMELATGLKIV